MIQASIGLLVFLSQCLTKLQAGTWALGSRLSCQWLWAGRRKTLFGWKNTFLQWEFVSSVACPWILSWLLNCSRYSKNCKVVNIFSLGSFYKIEILKIFGSNITATFTVRDNLGQYWILYFQPVQGKITMHWSEV